MKYFIEYTLGFSGASNKKADKGTIFHKFMEVLAVIKLAKQNRKRIVNDDICGKIKIPKNLSDIDVDKLVNDIYDYYTSKIHHHEWLSCDLKDCKKWVIKALEFSGGQFDPRKQEIVQPEQNFNIELSDDWARYDYLQYGMSGYLRLMGTIDLIINIGNNAYEIIDYKTGRNTNWATGETYTYENIHHNFQLRFYHLVCSILYPNIELFTVTIFFLNDGGPITLTLGPDDLQETKDLVRAKFEEIRNTEVPELKKSWKCTKFCPGGTKDFNNTNVLPIIGTDYNKGNFSSVGEPLKQCDQVSYVLKHRNIETVIKNMTKTDHNADHYKAPGSI